MPRLVSRTEFAVLAGVSKPSITKAAKMQFPGGCVGPRIDLDHPDVQRYLDGKAGGSTSYERAPVTATYPPPALRPSTKPLERPAVRTLETGFATPARLPAKPPAEPDAAASGDHREATPDDIAKYAHLTLDQLTRRFGTSTGFKDWLEARQRISAIREKDLKNEERAGRLIPRELVKTHVFSHIEAANRRLLQDAATTIARRVYAAAKGGTPVEEAEQTVREILGSHLRPLSVTAARVLRGEGEAIDDGRGSEARAPD